jgi:hypothetical protein
MKVEELTVAFTENGKEKVRELAKRVLAQSTSWATLAFLFQEADAATGEWKPQKLSLRRYRKKAGRYVVDKHFTLSSERQVHELKQALAAWFTAPVPGVSDASAPDATSDPED